MNDQNTKVVFRRIHGRLVPIKVKRNGPNWTDPVATGDAARKGVAAATGAYGAVKGVQYALFKRGSRLFDISRRFGARPAPTMHVDSRMVRGKTKLLSPSIFNQQQFKKASEAFAHNQQRASRFAAAGAKFKNAAAFVGRHSIKTAIGVGILAAGAVYLRHIALDHTKRKLPK